MIHQTAIIDEKATLGQNVRIGPFCVVGADVIIGNDVELKSHVVVSGKTSIGDGTVIYPFASIGAEPQDLKYKGERSSVEIGKNNVIREYVTIQRGTEGGRMSTSIGDNGLFMVGVHIAHDCIVGNNVICANYVSLAGHVEVGDHVIIGGLSAVLQHVRIGKHAMIGGVSAVVRDLIPFGLATNDRAHLEGLNLVGMKRRGFDKLETLEATKVIDQLFQTEGIFFEKMESVEQQYKNNSIIQEIIEFLRKDSARSFCHPVKK